MRLIFFTFILWIGSVQLISQAVADPPPPVDISLLERQIHQRINRERNKYGLTALDRDEQLVAIARDHSRNMASHHFFSHINLHGEGPSERAMRQGWDKKKQISQETLTYGVAENIYLARLYDKIFSTIQNGITIKREYLWKSQSQIVQTIVDGWMNSPSHRKIILSPQIDRQGIGVHVSGTDVYVTENLF